uniref:Uncharacterized protein n=1 Tax=Nelumbo nucifera TaxID=4432 RepID=A0A822Z8S0_NELNU|nr:TPA_asm: hypothetical protein HUJ06_015286 [Nelumbo nucifera]
MSQKQCAWSTKALEALEAGGYREIILMPLVALPSSNFLNIATSNICRDDDGASF